VARCPSRRRSDKRSVKASRGRAVLSRAAVVRRHQWAGETARVSRDRKPDRGRCGAGRVSTRGSGRTAGRRAQTGSAAVSVADHGHLAACRVAVRDPARWRRQAEHDAAVYEGRSRMAATGPGAARARLQGLSLCGRQDAGSVRAGTVPEGGNVLPGLEKFLSRAGGGLRCDEIGSRSRGPAPGVPAK